MSVSVENLRVGGCYTSRVLGCVRRIVEMDERDILWEVVPSIYPAGPEEGVSRVSVFARLTDWEADSDEMKPSWPS